jgi:hypothetical protein
LGIDFRAANHGDFTRGTPQRIARGGGPGHHSPRSEGLGLD